MRLTCHACPTRINDRVSIVFRCDDCEHTMCATHQTDEKFCVSCINRHKQTRIILQMAMRKEQLFYDWNTGILSDEEYKHEVEMMSQHADQV